MATMKKQSAPTDAKQKLPAITLTADQIRTIQQKEGNFPCFQTASDYCDQGSCSWRGRCLPN